MQAEPAIENQLADLRQKRGFSAVELARLISVTRQTIYAIEAGTYTPNTAVALRLARVLDVKVENLFTLPDEEPASEPVTEDALLLPFGYQNELPRGGQPAQLCRVGKRLVATPASSSDWYLPDCDGVFSQPAKSAKKALSAKVQIFNGDYDKRILIAGCDPAISVLARHVRAAGAELIFAHRNSSQALALLKQGSVHIAGTHLRDDVSGESNLKEVRRLFPDESVTVVAFSMWEEGIVTAKGNPKEIQGLVDVARRDVTIVNREAGAGSRKLLDTFLKKMNIPSQKVRGYEQLAPGHLAAASAVAGGKADCCVATRAASRVHGLDFIPLVSERYDLVLRRSDLDLPAVQAMFDALNRSRFRRELAMLGGYETSISGKQIL